MDWRSQPCTTQHHDCINNLIREGAAAYRRQRHLPRLIAIEPSALADHSRETGMRIIARLNAALRGERARGRAGHWAYDLNRHIGLMQAYRAETSALNDRITKRRVERGIVSETVKLNPNAREKDQA